MRWLLVTTVLALSLSPSVAFAPLVLVPARISFQGYVTDSLQNPISGVHQMIFSIYDAQSGGNLLWSETQTVQLDNGQFHAYLGENTPLPASIFPGQDRWLQISIDGTGLPTRQPLVSVAYSFKAQKADTASYALSAPAPVLSDGYYCVIGPYGEEYGTKFFASLTDSANTVVISLWYRDNSTPCPPCEWSTALPVPQSGTIVGLYVTCEWLNPFFNVLISYSDGKTYAATSWGYCETLSGGGWVLHCTPPNSWVLVNDFGFSEPFSSPRSGASHP